jgi:hypothetical protein
VIESFQQAENRHFLQHCLRVILKRRFKVEVTAVEILIPELVEAVALVVCWWSKRGGQNAALGASEGELKPTKPVATLILADKPQMRHRKYRRWDSNPHTLTDTRF